MPFPISQSEVVDVALQFALQLRDGYANSDQLLGGVTATSGLLAGEQKDSSGTFLFHNLQAGAQNITVSSDPETPYYLPTQVAVTVPMPQPLWPAFPDITIANPALPLGDPGQAPAYKTQRLAATLFPTVAYPFPLGATLIRGTVLHLGQPLSATTVQQAGGTDPAYVTGTDGQFVLYLSNPPILPLPVTKPRRIVGMVFVFCGLLDRLNRSIEKKRQVSRYRIRHRRNHKPYIGGHHWAAWNTCLGTDFFEVSRINEYA